MIYAWVLVSQQLFRTHRAQLREGDCLVIVIRGKVHTHQDTSSGGLSGNQLAGPVLGLGHKSPLELLALAGRLLFLLLRVIWR